MIKRRIKDELEGIQNELKMNLENNYKDLAHDALKRFHSVIEQYKVDGVLKEKDYLKYKKIADSYSQQMQNYHH